MVLDPLRPVPAAISPNPAARIFPWICIGVPDIVDNDNSSNTDSKNDSNNSNRNNTFQRSGDAEKSCRPACPLPPLPLRWSLASYLGSD